MLSVFYAGCIGNSTTVIKLILTQNINVKELIILVEIISG